MDKKMNNKMTEDKFNMLMSDVQISLICCRKVYSSFRIRCMIKLRKDDIGKLCLASKITDRDSN